VRGDTMIEIDGSTGEGGGQVLRTSLALSLATGRAFRIERIRAGRKRPGLLRQHLTGVQAAKQVGSARVEGDYLGSMSLTFVPGPITPGDFTFAIGSAGSTTLVLQTVLPPLLLADGPSTVSVEGGTHNPAAPPFDFFDRVFLPCVRRLGSDVTAELVRPGFYPAGGGCVRVSVRPNGGLTPIDLLDRGEIVSRAVRVLLANLPRHIGEREVATVLKLMNWPQDAGAVIKVDGAAGPGNAVLVEVESEHAREIVTTFGETGTPAEAVAHRAVTEARRYIAAGVPVGCHLADQLMVLWALAGGGTFRTMTLSRHANTNADVIRKFVDVNIECSDEDRDVVRVTVRRAES
jgi:RNA 3'-terminal phosphate cyclase (ATP)